jgi:NAD(P)-dependent dehydrogenase (short-subunit alcohol dehydrogenase family)
VSGRLAGRNALVSGGAGGIGAACVLALLEEGCTVAATGISEAEIAPWREDERYFGVEWYVLDVSQHEQVMALAAATPKLDILVNCAGIVLRGDAAFDEEGFAKVMDINVAGTMRCCRAFLPQLKERPGTIVNIASMMSYFGSGTATSYAASKGAVAQLTKSLAIAWAPHGIRVNAIAPGWIETPMSRKAIIGPDKPYYDRVAARTPMGRWGVPEHIGRVVPLLCDDGAAWVTGVILPVDGGYSVY